MKEFKIIRGNEVCFNILTEELGYLSSIGWKVLFTNVGTKVGDIYPTMYILLSRNIRKEE